MTRSQKLLGVSLASGAIFGAGLCVSGMTRPEKVIGFLDVAGAWDPTLLCVMGGAVVVHFWAYRWASTSCPKSVPGSPAPAARVRGTANPAPKGICAFGTPFIFGETRRGLRVPPSRRSAPHLAERFSVPAGTPVDARLSLGAALFGIGWGVSGYCPGPALVSLPSGGLSVLVFVGTMLAGMWLASFLARASSSPDGSITLATPARDR